MDTKPFFIDSRSIERSIRNFNTRALANLAPKEFDRLPAGTVVLRWNSQGTIDTIIKKEKYYDLFLTLQEPQEQKGTFLNVAYRMRTFTAIGFAGRDFGYFQLEPGATVRDRQEKMNMLLLLETADRTNFQLQLTDAEGNDPEMITLGHKKIVIGGQVYKYAILPHLGVSYALTSPDKQSKAMRLCFVAGVSFQ